MMSSFNENEDEQHQFFDAHDDLDASSLSESNYSLNSSSVFDNYGFGDFGYHVWEGTPESVIQRRSKFLNWMGLSSDNNSVDVCSDYDSLGDGGVDRVRETSGAELRNSGFEDEFCSSRSSMSIGANEQDEPGFRDRFECRIGNSDGGAECDEGSEVSEFQELKSNRLATVNVCQNMPDSSVSSSVQRVLRREIIDESSSPMTVAKRIKRGWLSRLRTMSCILDRDKEIHNLAAINANPRSSSRISRIQRVKVRQCRKRMKELSALYKGQDIQAHDGSISTMKFSPDGKFLASAGEDGIVRVWRVIEDERSNDHDIPEIDPMCIYFTVNHLSELTPVFADKEKLSKLRSLKKKTSDSACVIFPPKVFRILEKPLHEFHGHTSEILDLSWSNNNHLLSSSIDKTVRLWRVGYNHCLKVFSHNDYVTCVQFNPVDDNYFISGSIDGKVRIWAIPGCQVVDWTDIREIVTAVCYRPDGQGGIVGSMTGTCRFYNVSDNHLQLDSQICLHGKKKSVGKRITGFQFSPQDPSTVMVTCADSQVRILRGTNVIGKYKGLRNAGSQTTASFTSDGKHIVSASDDSNVYVWNCSNERDHLGLSQAKSIKAFEHFLINASVAVPWCGMKYGNPQNGWRSHGTDECSSPLPSPVSFSLGQEFFLDSFPKGSATWPEEKLPPTSSLLSVPSAIRKSEHKFLKASCQSTSSSHAWGLVIVTAGWDGRIRSFHNYGLPSPL